MYLSLWHRVSGVEYPPLKPAPSARISSSSGVAPPVMSERISVNAFWLKYVCSIKHIHQWWRIFMYIVFLLGYIVYVIILTVDMRESKTLTANAVPQANGCVRYSSVSGSSSSSWSGMISNTRY